jgi:hypothetical protein
MPNQVISPAEALKQLKAHAEAVARKQDLHMDTEVRNLLLVIDMFGEMLHLELTRINKELADLRALVVK